MCFESELCRVCVAYAVEETSYREEATNTQAISQENNGENSYFHWDFSDSL